MFLSQFTINLFGFRAAKEGSNIVGRIAEHGTWEELHDKGNIIATNYYSYYSYKLLLILLLDSSSKCLMFYQVLSSPGSTPGPVPVP